VAEQLSDPGTDYAIATRREFGWLVDGGGPPHHRERADIAFYGGCAWRACDGQCGRRSIEAGSKRRWARTGATQDRHFAHLPTELVASATYGRPLVWPLEATQCMRWSGWQRRRVIGMPVSVRARFMRCAGRAFQSRHDRQREIRLRIDACPGAPACRSATLTQGAWRDGWRASLARFTCRAVQGCARSARRPHAGVRAELRRVPTGPRDAIERTIDGDDLRVSVLTPGLIRDGAEIYRRPRYHPGRVGFGALRPLEGGGVPSSSLRHDRDRARHRHVAGLRRGDASALLKGAPILRFQDGRQAASRAPLAGTTPSSARSTIHRAALAARSAIRARGGDGIGGATLAGASSPSQCADGAVPPARNARCGAKPRRGDRLPVGFVGAKSPRRAFAMGACRLIVPAQGGSAMAVAAVNALRARRE